MSIGLAIARRMALLTWARMGARCPASLLLITRARWDEWCEPMPSVLAMALLVGSPFLPMPVRA